MNDGLGWAQKAGLVTLTVTQGASVALWWHGHLVTVAPALPDMLRIGLAVIGGCALDVCTMIAILAQRDTGSRWGSVTAASFSVSSACMALDLTGVLPFDGRWLVAVYAPGIFAFTQLLAARPSVTPLIERSTPPPVLLSETPIDIVPESSVQSVTPASVTPVYHCPACNAPLNNRATLKRARDTGHCAACKSVTPIRAVQKGS